MAGGATGGGHSQAAERRLALAGKGGWGGLVHNRRVFAIAIYASLGGLLYGYNQGVFSSVLTMFSFDQRMASAVNDPTTKGWLVSILELGAWFGVLNTGYIADYLSRKWTIFCAVFVFCIGVIVQITAQQPSSIYGGRFITGMGVGSLSMAVPLYNAELAPPEVRGSLVALQQLAITFGIMISFWIDYGTNYIGGTGSTQSEAAWRLPLALQLVPALILGAGILFMPYSPRWLISKGRDEQALKVLSHMRRLPEDHELVQIEYLEIRTQVIFEQEVSQEMFPQYQGGTLYDGFMLGVRGYLSLLTNRVYLRRTAVGTITMFFQQWTGVNAILYYAPSIFGALGLTGNTVQLLATGVVGIVMWIATIPAVIWVDDLGRKPVLISGAFLMGACHIIIAILTALFQSDWGAHGAAGWAACALVWVFAIGFGYSWGPCAWIIVAEVYPLSIRGKGMSIAASSNWMNNFIVGQVTPTMMSNITYGTFLFFGIFSLMGGFYIWFFVPETKGLTLEEIDEAFGDTTGTAVKDEEHQAAIAKRIGLIALLEGRDGSSSPQILDDSEKKIHEENV
ncbi:general substrate transporter [Dacryopinax primogenitus]|uniref:General substrate transporter n=1 Tax=Dacryopinax primogenitus (strain DJM 731) TaxID=1858805 RepID=M5FZ14_DACPD|nr:general substrate transporter [Dacryopinax primogenitus]EJT96717.1 general substrate transporter [Dacryopinax primogenitus]